MGKSKKLKIYRKEARKQVSEVMDLEQIPELRLELERNHVKIRKLHRSIGILVIFAVIEAIIIIAISI